MGRSVRLAWMLTFGALAGCSEDYPIDVVDNDLWSFVSEENDPFRAVRDPEAECNPLGVSVEGGGLEVQTDGCVFVTMTQPAQYKAKQRHQLDILTYHSALFSDPDSLGYMAVAIGEDIVWEQTVPIPGDADVYSVTLESFPALSVGTPVYFHVHNHGANSWKLAHIRLVAPTP